MRARDYGFTFGDLPTGALNSLTDVPGIKVGHTTLIRGESENGEREGVVRTGVTAIIPSEDICENPMSAGYFSFNGNGEMTGTAWIEEAGILCTPIGITNTHSVGVVRDSIIKYCKRRPNSDDMYVYSVVGETWDGWLNDVNGMHVTEEDTLAALDSASTNEVREGNVGGGTGMVCFEFKAGIGTSSRVVEVENNKYTVGVLVQANFGKRDHLIISGRKVGKELSTEVVPGKPNNGQIVRQKSGSIIIIVGTDAPLLPSQCKRIAKRATIGLAATGSIGENNSGDIFLAFSTANRIPRSTDGTICSWDMLHPDDITPLFQATAEATEEAIINSLFAGETMTGICGWTIHSLPVDRLLDLYKK